MYRPPQPSAAKTPTFADSLDNYDGASQSKSHVPSSQPWQERYGLDSTNRGQSGPRPYGASAGGDVDSTGIKSWQLSHLRALEAKGYRVVTPVGGQPAGGPVGGQPVFVASHSASEEQLDGEVRSFAPYLVSDRTMSADLRQTLQRATGIGTSGDVYLPSPALGVPGRGPSPYQQPQPKPFRPASGVSYPFSPTMESSLPYCDL